MSGQECCPAAGGRRPLGIYLHIPFCKRKCLYCDFLSAPAADETIAEYVNALCAQIAREAPMYQNFWVRTVFFGGGTPSLLSPHFVGKIMRQLTASFDLTRVAEVTMECNPGTLDVSRLKGYLEAGINRLSIGLQSANDAELKALGRIHSYEEFLENYAAARRVGFTNINVDLMSALPGQTLEGWLTTLRRVAALSPEHISAYSLMIEEGTPFYEHSEELALPDEEEERRMYEWTIKILEQSGYHRYEISNYAKPGRECLHNVGYWERTDYLGLGLGAASLVDNVRWNVTDDLEEYLRQCGGSCEKKQRQVLSGAEQMEEFMFLGLRMTAGIAPGAFRRQFGIGIREVYGTVLEKLEQDGLLVFYEDGKKMKLTERGVDVSNYVLAQFLLDQT